MTDISKNKAIEVIEKANKLLKEKYRWHYTAKVIDAIQMEFAERQNDYGEYDIELKPHETISGHCEFVHIESDVSYPEGEWLERK